MLRAHAFSLALIVAGLGLAGISLLPSADAASAGATGSISGTVEYTGKPPAPVKIPATQDPYCAKKKVHDERVVVRDGVVESVHVGLKNGTAGAHAHSIKPVVVDQSGCMYRPRVVGLVNAQKVRIKNSDHTFHNVRGTHGDHTVFNHGQPQGFDPIEEKAGKPGEVLTLRCDIHPWMRGYAVVTDHPFFDVTDKTGTFTISDVPVGTHTVEAWHPELGKKTAKVTVKKGQTAKVTFRYP